MVYDSLDTIPCKVFFKIAETGDFSLLTNEKKPKSELKEIWDRLQKEHEKKSGNDKSKRLKNVYQQITKLHEQYTLITALIRYLWNNREQEFLDQLEKMGYKIDQDNYHESLSKAAKDVSGLLVKIERLKKRLPKVNDEKEDLSLDQSIYGYASVAEIPISDTNTVTMSQYYAIKKLGQQRMDAIKKSQSKIKS